MSKIKKIEGMPKFPELENKITQFWKENKIFEKSVEQRPSNDQYRFIDGPPFVSGMPHYGHLIVSIAKDVIPRYWTMKGKQVRRVWGWDCHGLPIEEKVNKKFGIKSSQQLEKELGVEKYVQECRKYVENVSDEWKEYIEKIGRWVDLDNAYYTMNPDFMESVIWAFKKIYDKGLVYKGKRVSLFSTDTSTPVSNFEVAMDADNYRDIEDLSIFTKFRLIDDSHNFLLHTDGNPVYLVAWTTTPWTIPVNFALAVNPDFKYVLVEYNGDYFIIANERIEYTFEVKEDQIGKEADKTVRIIKEINGIELEGICYEPVYDFFEETKTDNDFKVYLSDDVTSDEGTGVLHIAPAFGEVDFNIGKEHGLSDKSDIDEEGKITIGEWKGVYLREASPLIAEDLLNKGNLLRSKAYVHRLPFYRGENPLIYMAQEAYFINVQKIKDRMLELNMDTNWVPEHIKEKRFGHTIATSPDWCISRNRYWATIIPIWKNEDGEEIVIGSFEEMTKLTDQVTKRQVNGKVVYEFEGKPMDLHRDIADKIVLKKNGKEYRRIPEVLDCWMDSGSVPFAEYHYPFENESVFEKEPSADFIVEYVGQVRAWFNVILRLSTMLFDERAFKNVICYGVLAGNDGRKMSKTYGNYPDPKEVLNNIGGEALRLYMMGSPIMVGNDMNWSDTLLNEQVKNILIPLWNTYKYFTIYADLHHFKPKNDKFNSKNILDTWLETYMNQVTLDYSKALESYNLPESVKLIQPAIDNISSWFIRRSRDRFVNGDIEALQSLYAALVQFIKTFAPQLPFVTEEMYQALVVGVLDNAKESIHLEDYPKIKDLDTGLLYEMDIVREVSSVGLSIRVENGLKLRQPLSTAFIDISKDSSSIKFLSSLASDKNFKAENLLSYLRPELLHVIKEELNVKNVEILKKSKNSKDFISKSSNGITVTLDTFLTSELINEGLKNELTRQIQNLRKNSGFQMEDKVKIKYFSSSIEVRDLIDEYKKEISEGVNAISIEYVEDLLEGKSVKIDDKEIELHLEK